ncbi:phytanoyl-CoA dioxygenase family protein [Sphingomonas sp. AOB5]|uniref:phytanoyl-CoA dioxygenase family protein n=1 Tax=Sphingomonas sp. AOB5 TaxID=3034017 RepID=UPI0023F89BFA|nr:phytanoyl-CoA dioxygenase family protein [Sphingomonas sp. AOB5]MDF7775204.1 phytanoyl-CoA dioxygenase family protein [Sphingomonas sp. AOB5]
MSGTELVRGLRDYWESASGRVAPRPLTNADRVRLDVLGLGLGQTMQQLMLQRPDYSAFESWILETAGTPDPLAVARFHAWLDGLPPPEPVRAMLAEIDDAGPALDADEMARWDRDGYVVLRNAVTPEQAADAAALVWQIANADPDDPSSWYATGNGSIMIEQFQHPAQTALRASKRIHKAFAQLHGTADLWCRVDRMSFSPPSRPGSPHVGHRLHWDCSLALPVTFETHAILYLTDTAADQGALEVVPGFHRRLESWLEAIGDADPREQDISEGAITVAANAGDLVIWREETPHGASPNHAAVPRLAQYLYYYSADAEPNPVWR